MSTSFSANQYESAFVSHRLQNWEVPMEHKNRPKAQEGFTQIIANDRGHIQEDVHRSDKNPWGDFVGTWDLPKKIPGNCATVETARCANAQDKLRRHMKDSNVVIEGQQKNVTRKNKGDIDGAGLTAPVGSGKGDKTSPGSARSLLPPVDVPEGAPVSTMLEQDKQVTPHGEERRSGAEAPVPASTSPVKTPSPAPEAPVAEC